MKNEKNEKKTWLNPPIFSIGYLNKILITNDYEKTKLANINIYLLSNHKMLYLLTYLHRNYLNSLLLKVNLNEKKFHIKI
jgi:hypothetical protein